jgi:hypothetical protein
MKPSQKQFKHYRNIAQQSLDKFKQMAGREIPNEIVGLVERDWQSFIDSELRLLRYISHIDNVGSIFGFTRELSPKLSLEELIGRAAERFAEIDLAEHAIRELSLDKTGGKLEKLSEGKNKKCDFQFSASTPYYFSLSIRKISQSNLVK